MTILTLAALLRLIPYFLTFIRARALGYPWLAGAVAYIVLLVIVNLVLTLPSEIRGLLASLVAIFLMMHSFELTNRRK